MKQKIETALSEIEDCLLCASEIDELKDKSMALCAIEDALDILNRIKDDVEKFIDNQD
jgi:hypothetical protein